MTSKILFSNRPIDPLTGTVIDPDIDRPTLTEIIAIATYVLIIIITIQYSIVILDWVCEYGFNHVHDSLSCVTEQH